MIEMVDGRRDLDEETALIQRRIKWWRLQRKLSQQVVADRAGITRSYLTKIESGASRLDSRSTIDAIAHALEMSYAELTGQPIRPDTPALQAAHAAIGRIRTTHLTASFEDGAEVTPRDLDAIGADVDRAADGWQECDYAAAGGPLGPAIAELYAHAAAGNRAAVPIMVTALDTASWTARVLGHYDLAHALAERSLEAAQYTGDKALVAWAQFTRTLMVAAAGTRERAVQSVARRRAERAITELSPKASTSKELQVLGMLHLAGARADIIAGGDGQAALDEASGIAERTGEGNAFRLHFGPTNVAIWQVHIAAERREGGRAAEIARGVRPEAITSRARRSMYYRHLGLALAQDPAKGRSAVQALLRAERVAPGKLRLDPLALHTVEHMLSRARATAGGTELLTLARYVGVL